MHDDVISNHSQVVEEELGRVPAALARRNSQQLWSMVYLPQVGYVMQVESLRHPWFV